MRASLKTLLVQFFRYGIVGGIAFVADYGSLYLLTEFFHLHHLISAAIAFCIGLAVNYAFSTKWVFGESRFRGKWAEFTVFALIGVAGLGLNELIIWFFSDILPLHYMASKLISTAVVFLWNFLARKFIIFPDK